MHTLTSISLFKLLVQHSSRVIPQVAATKHKTTTFTDNKLVLNQFLHSLRGVSLVMCCYQ